VSIKKTKTHHTKVQHTKVEKTRTARTKVHHDSLLTAATDESLNVRTSATSSERLTSGSTSDEPTSASLTMTTNLERSQTLTVSDSKAQETAIASSGQSSPGDRTDGGESPLPSVWQHDETAAAQRAIRITARPIAVDRTPVVEVIHPWPSAILDRSSFDPSMDELDLAIEILGKSSLTGRREPPPTDSNETTEPPTEFGVTTLVATIALAGGGYQLAIREPGSRRSRWWLDEPTTW
jgi:hypothetical protein